MDKKIIGVFHNPWRAEYDTDKSLAELYERALWLKANPRSEDYMMKLFAQRYPQGLFINADEQPDWAGRISSADLIVLLYPDAIGIKFSPIESLVKSKKNYRATVRALNGRRRDFILSRRAIRQLRLRRFLERSMLGEALAIVAFMAVTPFFVISDLVRGRR